MLSISAFHEFIDSFDFPFLFSCRIVLWDLLFVAQCTVCYFNINECKQGTTAWPSQRKLLPISNVPFVFLESKTRSNALNKMQYFPNIFNVISNAIGNFIHTCLAHNIYPEYPHNFKGYSFKCKFSTWQSQNFVLSSRKIPTIWGKTAENNQLQKILSSLSIGEFSLVQRKRQNIQSTDWTWLRC